MWYLHGLNCMAHLVLKALGGVEGPTWELQGLTRGL